LNKYSFFCHHILISYKKQNIKKKALITQGLQQFFLKNRNYLFGRASDETDSFFLPFRRLALSTFLPALEDILSLKPCLFFLFLFEGWNVLLLIALPIK